MVKQLLRNVLVVGFWVVPLFCLKLNAQSNVVKIQEVKSWDQAAEFILTWESTDNVDYKQKYYAIKAILEEAPMVERQVFWHQNKAISATVRKPAGFDDLRHLFETNGFTVPDASDDN